ncbi:hypothetical protein COU37_04585 [Candidatus Micrarchaeota archaeon CG10_big_fil_rev_8_21_14_0_10_45_29]|nr:MAG: hypothetical protein COU37_04585 [Candidatus Micrarchaeota archaeon CG10_big_fil_rev_8_21_14_0_10_45_29]
MKIRCIPQRKTAIIAIASFFLFFNAHNANYAQSASFSQGKKISNAKVMPAKQMAELERAKEFIEKAKISAGREGSLGKEKSAEKRSEEVSETKLFLDSAKACLQKYENQKNRNGGKNLLVAFIAGAVISITVYFAIKLGVMHMQEHR